LSEEYRSLSATLCGFLHSPVTSTRRNYLTKKFNPSYRNVS
jgi:hypothetical protein